MLFDKFSGHPVLLFEDSTNFGIDSLHRLFGNVRCLRHGTSQENFTFVFGIDHDAHLVAHPETHNHITRKLRGSLKVVTRPGRHLVHKDFFGNTTTEQNRNARQKILLIVGIAVRFRQLHRQAQSTSARHNRHLVNRIGLGH